MRVRITEAFAGNADERYDLPEHAFRPGEETEVDDTLGAAWIESGRAAAIEEPEHHDAEEKKPVARASSHGASSHPHRK